MARARSELPNRAIQTLHRGLDIVTAVLLFTGQITIGGVFFAPGDFALSLSGPFTGSGAVGITENTKIVLDGLDIIVALLLVINQIQVIGTYITSDKFTIVVGGPPFGSPQVKAYLPRTREFYEDMRNQIVSSLKVRI